MYPVWARTAWDFSLRLDRLPFSRGRFLGDRMREYAAEFDTWESDLNVGPDEKLRRKKVVGDYMASYREALDLLSKP